MLTEKDLPFIKALNKVLDEASFPVKRREVASLYALMNWVAELEGRVEKPKPKSKRKPAIKAKVDDGNK